MRPEGPRGITEDDLHAYLDGALEHGRRLDVALYLATRPFEAARLEAFRAQKEALHLLFDEVIGQAPPRKLRRVVRRDALRKAAARCVLALAALGFGTMLFLGASALGERLALTHGLAASTRAGEERASTITPLPVIPPPAQPPHRRGADL
jgi:anti-sigma factor RsiW